MTRGPLIVLALAVAVAAASVGLVFSSEHVERPYMTAALTAAVGLAFVAAGLVARHRRPENRTGTLMTITGFTWYAGALAASDNAGLFTMGTALSATALAFFAYTLLAYPSGRLLITRNRLLVIAAFGAALPGQIAFLLFAKPADFGCSDCPENLLQVSDSTTAATIVEAVETVWILGLVVAYGLIVIQRLRVATPPLRRALAPFYTASVATLLLLGVQVVAGAISETVDITLSWITVSALLLVPLSFLYGLARSRLAHASLGRLVVELGEQQTDLRDALARALGDPSLELAYWNPEENAFVDASGAPLPAGDPSGPRFATVVERHGDPVAALIHDVSLLDDPELIDAATAAVGLTLENEQRLAALRRSQARNRALLDAIPDLMFRIARDGTYLDYRTETDRDLYDEEVIGKTVQERLPEPVAGLIMRSIERALAGESVETIEYTLDFDHETRHYEGRIVASGEDEVVLIVRDFTSRFRREQALRDSEAHNRALVDAMPDLMFRIGRDGIYRAFKADDPEKLIARPTEIVGRSLHDLLPAEVADRIMDAAHRAFEDWTMQAVEYQLELDGSTRDFEGRIVRVDDEQFLLIVRDFTERKAAEAELQASRARIVQAGDEARRRLERNLHDGAQQRLVAVSIAIRLANAKVEADPKAASELLTSASDELGLALEELRELARGIHPAILTDRGLGAALEALAGRSPVPVELDPPAERLPGPVEAAAYYVVSEALANVAKYAQASQVRISVAQRNGAAVVEVVDDGVGGADPASGSGLRGLADRVEALGGRLRVESPVAEGTRVEAEIPIA
jgi:signal transduction histidine kinase